MNRIVFLLLIATFGAAVGLSAQQESQYSSYMYNQLYYNPATSGARGVASVSANYRQQWLGFEGAPTSQMVSFNTPLIGDKVGLGLLVSHATKGITDNIYTSMAYSYSLKITDDSRIRLGIQGSLQRWSLDFTGDNVVVKTDNDNSLDPGNVYSSWEGNVGAGIFYQLGDYFEAGVSAPNLYASRFSVDETKGVEGATVAQHYYGYIGAIVPLTSMISLKPTILARYVDGAPFVGEINVGAIYSERVMAGLGYRMGTENADALNIMGFYQALDQFGIGASYEVGLSELASSTNGGIEVFGRFDFGSKRDDLVNPRFF